MKYIGKFRDINENLYQINITTTGDSTSTTEVVLGDVPILTEWESDKNMFKPCKYSSATIKLITDKFYFDIYSNKAKDSKVELLDEQGNVKWIGYVTPNLYNQSYETHVEELEIECIDGLSILQYFDYPKDNLKVASFSEIINKLLMQCGCYKHYYITNTIQLHEIHTGCTPSILCVSEQDFIDEDDEPMKMDEVMEEICKYFGVTCFAWGDSVYFVNYDAITRNFNTYFKFDVGGDTYSLVRETIADRQKLMALHYAENGQELSLSQTYNKVTVVDSLYATDSILPSMQDKKLLKNRTYPDKTEYVLIGWDKQDYDNWYKFYDHKYYKSRYYAKDTMVEDTFHKVYEYDDINKYVGATFIRNYKQKHDPDNPTPKLDYTSYILVHCLDKIATDNVPLMEMTMHKPLLVGSAEDTVYIVFQGGIIFNGHNVFMPNDEYGEKNDEFKEEDLYIEMQIRIGNQYFDGFRMTDQPSVFRLPFDADGNTKHLLGRELKVKKNIDYTMNLDDAEGYAVRLPKGVIFDSNPKITILQPKHKFISNYNKYGGYWLSNFDAKFKIANHSDDIEFESDTKYTNVNDEEFVNDFDDIKFKICTWDNKLTNYSSVGQRVGKTLTYVDKLYDKSTEDSGRAEEMYIKRVIRQYSFPAIMLDLAINADKMTPFTDFLIQKHFNHNKNFLVDSMSVDWRMNQNNCRIIEKR